MTPGRLEDRNIRRFQSEVYHERQSTYDREEREEVAERKERQNEEEKESRENEREGVKEGRSRSSKSRSKKEGKMEEEEVEEERDSCQGIVEKLQKQTCDACGCHECQGAQRLRDLT